MSTQLREPVLTAGCIPDLNSYVEIDCPHWLETPFAGQEVQLARIVDESDFEILTSDVGQSFLDIRVNASMEVIR